MAQEFNSDVKRRKKMEKELMEEGYKKHELDQLNFRRLTDFFETRRRIKQLIVKTNEKT